MEEKHFFSNTSVNPAEDIEFINLFHLQDIQRLQDLFSETNHVASIITEPSGNPITKPSNFTRLCNDIIRKTQKGKVNCIKSDSIIGKNNTGGPLIQPCLSCGLWDAGASITVGGKHIANWLIGQVRNEQLDEQKMIEYAEEIGAERAEFFAALNEVPEMSVEKFEKIATLLFEFAKQLSDNAYNNLKLQKQISEHKKTIETLNKSELLYHDLVETAQDLIWQCDAEGKYTYLNPAWEEVFGYKIEEMQGKKFIDFQSREWAERDLNEFKRLLKGNTVKGLETVHIGKDGKEINLLFNAKFVHDKNGKTIGTRGTAFSITNIKKTEKALIESESKYSSLFSSMKEGVVIHELVYDKNKIAVDYKIVEANPAFKNHTGINANNIKNQLASKFYGTEIAPYLDIYSKVAISGEPIQFDTYFEPLNKHFSISVFSPQKGWFATVFTDITERKQAVDALRISENRYRDLIEFAVEGILLGSLEGIITGANSNFLKLSGRNLDELIGKHINGLFSAEEIKNTPLRFDLLQKGEKVINERNLVRPDGKTILIEMHTKMMPDGTYQSIYRDITLQKKAEEKIRNQLEELKRFNATMIEREIKMIQLKEEVNDYCEKLDLPLKYSIPKI